MTDFPDRDEWTDRPDPPESIEAEKAALEREKAEQRALYDAADEMRGDCDNCGEIAVLTKGEVTGIETYACAKCRGIDAEWDALGATDLLSAEELAAVTKDIK